MAESEGAVLDLWAIEVWAALVAECGGVLPGDWTVDRLQGELGRVGLAMIAKARAEADG